MNFTIVINNITFLKNIHNITQGFYKLNKNFKIIKQNMID